MPLGPLAPAHGSMGPGLTAGSPPWRSLAPRPVPADRWTRASRALTGLGFSQLIPLAILGWPGIAGIGAGQPFP
jgi:hypothetical protein